MGKIKYRKLGEWQQKRKKTSYQKTEKLIRRQIIEVQGKQDVGCCMLLKYYEKSVYMGIIRITIKYIDAHEKHST